MRVEATFFQTSTVPSVTNTLTLHFLGALSVMHDDRAQISTVEKRKHLLRKHGSGSLTQLAKYILTLWMVSYYSRQSGKPLELYWIMVCVEAYIPHILSNIIHMVRVSDCGYRAKLPSPSLTITVAPSHLSLCDFAVSTRAAAAASKLFPKHLPNAYRKPNLSRKTEHVEPHVALTKCIYIYLHELRHCIPNEIWVFVTGT